MLARPTATRGFGPEVGAEIVSACGTGADPEARSVERIRTLR
jgi:hypothetical protein